MYYKLPTNEELKLLDQERIQVHFVKIEVLDMNEMPITEIQGKVKTGGSINIDGSSSIRRTLNINFIVDENELNFNVEDIKNIISINKRIRVFEGIENDGILENYPEKIWIPLGIYVIMQPSISYSSSGLNITLSCKDKMVLLNGEAGGSFPAPITFSSYNQVIGHKKCIEKPERPNTYTVYEWIENDTHGNQVITYNRWNGYSWERTTAKAIGEVEDIPQRIYDIIQTVVCNYGGIPISKIFINDVELEIKQLVRFTGSGVLYYNTLNGTYTINPNTLINTDEEGMDYWRAYKYNDDVGYIYTDLTFPGELTTAIGDNVCTVLDKIKEVLGNYEYFFDVDGNFVFQEIKNYLNKSYNPTVETRLDNHNKIYIDENGHKGMTTVLDNNLSIIDITNYKTDIYSNTKIAYDFSVGNGLISSYSNAPNYANIKNDYHIWGSNEDKNVIHYHVALKRKPDPSEFGTYMVMYERTPNNEYTGKVILLDSEQVKKYGYKVINGTLHFDEDTGVYVEDERVYMTEKQVQEILAKIDKELETALGGYRKTLLEEKKKIEDYYYGVEPPRTEDESKDGVLKIPTELGAVVHEEEEMLVFSKVDLYTPADWRAELYLRGLRKLTLHERPDVYEQELLDLFDSVYDFYKKEFKSDFVKNPNVLNYFFDFLDPSDEMFDFSVDNLGTKIHSYQQDKIKRLYPIDVPNLILVNKDKDIDKKVIDRCEKEGQAIGQVSDKIYQSLSVGTIGYTAQEVFRDLLYQHTAFTESINITSVPIYHLEPNTRIKVEDPNSGITGDYIIRTISLPLGGQGQMTISATRALERI